MGIAPRNITTRRLLLRPFVRDDTSAYAAIRSKPEVVRYLPGGEGSVDRAHQIAQRTVQGFANLWMDPNGPGYGPWAVIERSSGRLIGHLGLRRLPELGDETELLYMLDSTVWGQGLVSEGARSARDYGFDRLKLARLIAIALPDNLASLQVMKKIGMTREPGFVDAFGLKVLRCVMNAGDQRT